MFFLSVAAAADTSILWSGKGMILPYSRRAEADEWHIYPAGRMMP
jgi:hypothetical protein